MAVFMMRLPVVLLAFLAPIDGFFAPGAVSVIRPSPPLRVWDDNDGYIEYPTGIMSTSGTRSNLAEGWREDVDPRTGETYYYNFATGETMWERPVQTTGQLASKASIFGRQETRELGVVEPYAVGPAPTEISWIDTDRLLVEDDEFMRERIRQQKCHQVELTRMRNMMMMGYWGLTCPIR